MVTPYLPDIIGDIVNRVSQTFNNRYPDNFPVFFEKGLHQQASRSVDANTWLKNGDSLIWLEMPVRINTGNWRVYGEAEGVDLYIMVGTDNTYTQQQRDDASFKLRLLPIYGQLVKEINRERWFSLIPGGIPHTMQLLPFWGLGTTGGSDKENALGRFVDAIRVRIPKLGIKKNNNCNAGREYPVLT